MKIGHDVLRILIIEDNQDSAESVGDFLMGQNHIVDFAMDGLSGMYLAMTQVFDVIALDITLPGMDGLTFCKKYRSDSIRQTPIIIMTARDTLEDKLAGFEAGADDYLVKPFSYKELAARIRALHRRGRPKTATSLRIGELEMNLFTMEAKRAGTTLELSRVSLMILTVLMESYPNLVTKQELEIKLWGNSPPESDALRSHVYSLRGVLDKPFSRAMLQTVHGVGYKLVDENDK